MDWISPGEQDERDAVSRAMAQRDFEDLKREVNDLKTSVDGLVNAWETATSVVVFVKWLSAAIAAAGALWLILKGKFVI